MEFAPVVALEIGTTRTVALIGEKDQSERISITGKGIYATHGVRKGMIYEPGQVKVAVTSAVKAADDDADVSVGSVFLGIRGGCIQTFQNRVSHELDETGGKVTRQDIESINEDASDFSSFGKEFTILHAIRQCYSVDDRQKIVRPPVGLVGDILALDSFGIFAKNSQYQTLRSVVQDSDYDVEEIAFSGLCSALAVLTAEQKTSGVVVIDLGGGTTDYIAYSGDEISAAGSFAVGGEHITNDIAAAFALRTAQAETLKIRDGNAKVVSGNSLKRVNVSGDLSKREHSISVKSLHTVINARMTEILKLVRAELLKRDILTKITAGVVFTGGGAAMPGLLELGEDVFGVPCQIGIPKVGGHAMEGVADPWAFASTIGLVMYGFMNGRPESSGGLFSRLFGGGKTR